MIVTCFFDDVYSTTLVGNPDVYHFTNLRTFPFPASFVSNPYFLGATGSDSQVVSILPYENYITTTSFRLSLHTRVARTSAPVAFKASFIGRWK